MDCFAALAMTGLDLCSASLGDRDRTALCRLLPRFFAVLIGLRRIPRHLIARVIFNLVII